MQTKTYKKSFQIFLYICGFEISNNQFNKKAKNEG